MKITKNYLKQIILEELQKITEGHNVSEAANERLRGEVEDLKMALQTEDFDDITNHYNMLQQNWYAVRGDADLKLVSNIAELIAMVEKMLLDRDTSGIENILGFIQDNFPDPRYDAHRKEHGEEGSEYIGSDGKRYLNPWDEG